MSQEDSLSSVLETVLPETVFGPVSEIEVTAKTVSASDVHIDDV